MSISSIQSSGYTVWGDITIAGDAKLIKDDRCEKLDEASISEAGRDLARQMAKAKEQAAAEKTTEQRYAEALAAGNDYANTIENALSTGVTHEGREAIRANEFDNPFLKKERTNTYTTEQGTIIGVSGMMADNDWENLTAYTLQITRKDGLQLNLDFNEDVRVNDLENGGLSVHYAQSGLTRIFDAAGNETQTKSEGGELKGTAGNDVLINRHSKNVDAGDGDDVLINLASNVNLAGGNGNDKIINMGKTLGVNIDTGAGDDVVYANFQNGSLNLSQGKNTVYANSLWGETLLGDGDTQFFADDFSTKTIMGNGNLTINTRSLNGKITQAEGTTGKLDLTADSIHAANINLTGNSNSISTRSVSSSEITMIGDENNISATTMGLGNVTLTGNNNTAMFGNASHSNITLNGGSNNTSYVGTLYKGGINAGSGNSVYTKVSYQSNIDSSGGNNSIHYSTNYDDDKNAMNVNNNSGNKVNHIPNSSWDAFIKNPHAFALSNQVNNKNNNTPPSSNFEATVLEGDQALQDLIIMRKTFLEGNKKPSFEEVKEYLLQMFAKNNYSEEQLAKLWEQA
jgi:hypothetical protein